MTGLATPDAGPVPTALVAVTVKVQAVPLPRPVTAQVPCAWRRAMLTMRTVAQPIIVQMAPTIGKQAMSICATFVRAPAVWRKT